MAPRSARKPPAAPTANPHPVGGLRPLGWMGLVVGLALLSWLVYLPAWRAPFVFDDLHLIVDNPAIKDSSGLWRFLADPSLFSGKQDVAMYRPLTMISLVFNYRTGKLDPLGWHWINQFIHVLCGVLVGGLAWRLMEGRFDPVRRAGGALGAAAVFLLHPIQSEAVIYTAARSGTMAALGWLASVTGWLAWRSGRSPWRGTALSHRARRVGLAVSLAAFVAALLCKEEALTLVAMPILMEWMGIGRAETPRRRTVWILVAVYAAIGLAYLGLRHAMLGTAFSNTPIRPVPHNLLTQIKAMAIYLRLIAFPVGLNAGRTLPIETSAASIPVLGSLALLSTLVGAAIWQRRRLPGVALGVFWFFLTLAPTSSVIPLNQIMAERRLYLPMAGVGLMAGWGLGVASVRMWKPAISAFLLGVCAWGVLDWQRAGIWADPMRLWEEMAARSPSNPLNHFGLGNVLKERGRSEEAMEHYHRAIALDGLASAEVYANLGNLMKDAGQFGEAERAYRKALSLRPRYSLAINNLASLYASQERYDEARPLFERSLEMQPEFWAAHYNLGNIDYLRKDYPSALKHYGQALRLNPQAESKPQMLQRMTAMDLVLGFPAEARVHAEAWLEASHWDRETARTAFQLYERHHTPEGIDYAGLYSLQQRMAREDPGWWENWAALGAVARRLGDSAAAIGYYRRALESGAPEPQRDGIREAIRVLNRSEEGGSQP